MPQRKHLSQPGWQKLREWEGCRLEAYQDSGGVWTIGYGHTGPDVKRGLTWTQRQADDGLANDIRWAESAVNDYVKVDLLPSQFDALVSFTFNVGFDAFRTSTLLKRVNAGRFLDVPAEMARWNKVTIDGRKVVVQGLINRRAAEAALWASAADSAATAGARPVAPALKHLAKSKELGGSAVGAAGLVAAGTSIFSALGNLSDTAQLVAVGGLIVAGVAFWFLAGNRLIARLNGDR